MEPASVYQTGDDLSCLKGHARIARDESIEIGGWMSRLVNFAPPAQDWSSRQRVDNRSADLQRVSVVVREVVADAGQSGMKICTAQLLRSDVFAGRGFDKRWSRQIDGAGAFHNHVLIAHGRHIGPARRAHAHHKSNLWNAKCRHPGLVIEDAPKVLPVGK